ncbi:hypothetical protein [Cellulomonas soli]
MAGQRVVHMVDMERGPVSRLWVARAISTVVDNIDDVALFEAGSSWVQSGTVSGSRWRLELTDDYRDGTIEYVYWSADRDSVRRLRGELRKSAIASEQVNPDERTGAAISGVIPEAAVRPDGHGAQLAQLLKAIHLATTDDGSPHSLVGRPADFRSNPLAVAVRASLRTRRVSAVSPLMDRVFLGGARRRVEIWTNLGRETPWLLWVDARASETLSTLRARVPEGNWLEARTGHRRSFVAPCWARRTVSRAGRVVPAYSELVAGLDARTST